MNRCRLHPPTAHAIIWRLGISTALITLCALASAQERVRNFPPTAVRATMQVTNPPDMLLDGQAARLAPGARIRGVNNMLLMSGVLAGQNVVVNYVRGSMGLIQDVWVLNATEAQQPMPNATPSTNYVSDFAPAAPDGAASAVTSASSSQN